jgi:hypothetical protein
MVAALPTVFVYIVTAVFSLGVGGAAVGFVVVSSLLCKALGVVVASVRLELLRRSLLRRARRLQRGGHVYVH